MAYLKTKRKGSLKEKSTFKWGQRSLVKKKMTKKNRPVANIFKLNE